MRATFTHLLLLCIGFAFLVDAQADDKVSLKYIKEMKATGLRGMDVDGVIKLAEAGVSPQYVRDLKSMGMRNFDKNDAIRLAQAGVTAEYVKSAKMKYTRYFDANDVLRLFKAGVGLQYLKDMKGAHPHSLRHFDEKDLIALYKAGVPAEYIKDTRSLGLRHYDAKDAVKLHKAGVPAKYVKDTHRVGLRHFDADDAVKLHKAKLSAEFVRDAKGLGARDANAVIKLAAKTGHGMPVVAEAKPRSSRKHAHAFGMVAMSDVATVIGAVMLIGFAFFTIHKKRNLQAVKTGEDVDVRLAQFENRVNDLQDILLSIDDRLDRKLRRT